MKTEEDLSDLLVSKSLKLTSLCRLCLGENLENSISLFDASNLYEKVMLFTRLQIKNSDGLPELICAQCSESLDIVDKFREKCETSDTILHKYYINIELAGKCSTEEGVLPKKEEECPIAKIKKTKVKKSKHSKEKSVPIESVDASERKLLKEEDAIKKEIIDDDYDDYNNENNDSDEVKDKVVETEEIHNDLVENIASKKKFKCSICQRPLGTKKSLEMHLDRMHNTKKDRVGTVSGYGANRRFHCAECSYSTRHGQSLVYHMRVHTGEKPFKCDECDKTFAQPGSLTCHKKTHSDKMYYTCALCGKQFKYRETYETHKNVHVDEKKFVCTICNKGLKSSKTLEGHMNRHYNIKNYSCETCGATFVTRVELLNHSKKHKAERRFHCNLCDFKTYLKKGLELHIKRHTGERLFKCDACEVACYTAGELKCHMRKHTKEKSYSCPVCQLKFVQSSSVNKHMLKTHGIKYTHNSFVDRRVIK